MGNLSSALLIGGLAVWYSLTGNSNPKPVDYRYNLPAEIKIVETDLPYETRPVKIIELKSKIDFSGNVLEEKVEKVELEKIVKTKNIDFSKDFTIKTDRYRFVKGEDWLPSRLVGHVLSAPGKLFFWDHNYAWGQDADRTKAALAMVENDKDIKNLTIRLNHNEGFYDMYRMFTEEKLCNRNNIVARGLIGVPLSLGDEIWAEFSRGSYYNPLTQTVVCYSNIESITAHELGHHKDFQKFDRDWLYMISRVVPPVMLYQEWKASNNAAKIMSKDDEWQFNRYLMPAFLTYCLATYGMMKKLLSDGKEEEE
jgi:hypothetical protein